MPFYIYIALLIYGLSLEKVLSESDKKASAWTVSQIDEEII